MTLQWIVFSSVIIQSHLITEDDSEALNASSADVIQRLVAMFSQDCYENKNKELIIIQVR